MVWGIMTNPEPNMTALHLRAAYIHSLTEHEDASEEIMEILDKVDHENAEELKDIVLLAETEVKMEIQGHPFLRLLEDKDPE